MIRDHEHLVGLEEDSGGDLAVDNSTENTRHGAEYRLDRSECNIDLRFA
jgi:hypothetical protein